MFIQTEWLVVFFFIVLSVVFTITYFLSAWRKWIEKAKRLEEEKNKLENKLSLNSHLQNNIKDALFEFKEGFSDKQYKIFVLILEGYTTKEIGEKLFISSSTVDSHIREITKKLGVNTRPQISSEFIEKLKANAGISNLLELK
jgi:DNA-binding CsgD family transcriptional regulator